MTVIMRRRDFLKSSLPAAALLHSDFNGLLSQGSRQTDDGKGYDLIVIEGTLLACFAALHAARKGMKVLLVERRTFLGSEITAAMRPWLKSEGFADLKGELKDFFLPDAEQAEIGVKAEHGDAKSVFGDEIPLFMGTVKKQLMGMLVKSGVDVLVGSGVCGVLADKKRKNAAGLLLSNKFGLHIVYGRRIIDSRQQLSGTNRQAAYSVELYGVRKEAGFEIPVPDSLGLAGGKVFVHKGKRRPDQCFAELRFNETGDDVENEARQRLEKVFAYLVRKHNDFTGAKIMQMAWETFLPGQDNANRKSLYSNYLCAPSRVGLGLSCRDVIGLWNEAEKLAGEVMKSGAVGLKDDLSVCCGSVVIPLNKCRIDDSDHCVSGNFKQITIPYERYLKTELSADVVVAGGGTAGAMAAVGGIQEGARTVTVEYFSELGGTSTLGRVTGYYHGYKKTRFFDDTEQAFKEQSHEAGRCSEGVARMLYYRKQAQQQGGTLLTNSIICGVVKKGRRVTGIVVDKGGRLFVIAGKVVIDATGDGDVAAFAGADFDVGNKRMECTQNYSQWDVNPGMGGWKGETSTNRDYDIIWGHLQSEWQRAYRLSHQQSHHYDFSPMMTVREARRIKGEYTITLKDVILERSHTDTICLASSDYDPHFFGDNLFTRVGCLMPHGIMAVVEIPYRAILPAGIDGLLVSAKAISQTHNALQFTRMAFDIMTLGYVTGRIAAVIVREDISTRKFDVSMLRDDLKKLKILLTDDPAVPANSDKIEGDTIRLISDLKAGKQRSLINVLLHESKDIKKPLIKAFDSAEGDLTRLRLGKALAWFGDARGNRFILEEMKTLFEKEQKSGRLPGEYYREDSKTDYWMINQDIILLALSGDMAVMPEILAIADLLPINNPPVRQKSLYNRGRIDVGIVPFYNRMINICFAVERMPVERAVKTLNRFLDDKYISGNVCTVPEEAGNRIYGGILESRLAALLARCGVKRGFTLLAEYLNDIHPMLVQYAAGELKSILRKDYGSDCGRWKACIECLSFPASVAPSKRDFIEI